MTIDASVTPKEVYDKELGNYTYNIVLDGFKSISKKTLDQVGELCNTVLFAGRPFVQEMTFLYNSEDELLVQDKVPEILKDASELEIDISEYQNIYSAVCLDEELYESLGEYYQADCNNTWIPDEMFTWEKTYIAVFFQHEIEEGITLIADSFIYFQVEKEEEVKGIEEVVYEDFESPQTVMISTGDMVEAAINEKNEIEIVCRGSRFDIKEKIGTVKVKSLKEMLHIIKDDFSNVYTPGTTIYDISLAYVPYLSEEKDETGLRKLYLAPYWCVSYYTKQQKDGELFTWRNRIFYLGETGEKVYEE